MHVGLVVDRLRAAGCVFAEDEAALLVDAAGSPRRLEDLVRRRVSGEPLEQVLGWAAFDGLRIAVGPGVFVPRRRTELLVREAAALVRPGAVVVDLCCGSGAVGAALLARSPRIVLHAADVDPAAVRCARGNLPGVPVHEGDLFAALPDDLRGRIGVLVANVPYVPTTALALMPPEARDHEPRSALDGGDDGLDVARRVVREAGAWLAPGGSLLFEAGEAQVPAAVAALTAVGLRPRVGTDDEQGATVVVGSRVVETGRVSDDEAICSAKGCQAPAGYALVWNNPKVHTPEREKIWLACGEHREPLSHHLAARSFLRRVDPLDRQG